MNGRLKQAVVGVLVVTSVSAVGASVTLSQLQEAARVRRAVKTQPKVAAPAVVREASESVVTRAESLTTVAAEREASTLSRVARTHSVQLNNGSITGAIQALGPGNTVRNLTDVRVSFFQNGSMVSQTAPGADGVFNATLAPGFYTLVAFGPSGYVAYGIDVVDQTAAIRSAGFEKAESSLNLQIESLVVPPVDFKTLYRLTRAHVRSEVAAPVPTRAASPAEKLPDLPMENAEPQTNLKHHTVTLEADGTLVGQIKRIHPQTGDVLRVHSLGAYLVQGGSVVHQATVSEDGSLKFSAVAPGVYSFMTAGSEGFSAFSIVVAPALATASANAIKPVSFQPPAGGPLSATPGAPADMGPATAPLGPPSDLPPDAPPEGIPPGPGGGGFGGGPGGGVGGGGAGGGGGGLGLGLLLGGAGLAIGLAADDDDDDNRRPVSPANPGSGS